MSPPTAAPGSSISINGVFPTATGQHGPIASACIANPTNPLCALLDVIATVAAPPLCGLPELLADPFCSSLKATPTLAPKDFCQGQPLDPFCVSLEAVASKTLPVVCAIDSPLALDPFCPSLLNGLPVREPGLLASACVSSPTNLLYQSLSAVATSVLPSLCGLSALVNDPFCLLANATPILDAPEDPVVNTAYNGEVLTWHSNQQMVFHVRPPIVDAPFKRAPAAEPFCEGHPKDVQQLYNESQAFCKSFVNLKCDLSPKVSSNIPVLVSATKSIASSESVVSASSDEAAHDSSIATQRSAESASHQSDISQFTATATSDNLGGNKGGSQFSTAANTNTEQIGEPDKSLEPVPTATSRPQPTQEGHAICHFQRLPKHTCQPADLTDPFWMLFIGLGYEVWVEDTDDIALEIVERVSFLLSLKKREEAN